VIARIAMNQLIDANQDPRSTGAILQVVDPSSIVVRLLYAHG